MRFRVVAALVVGGWFYWAWFDSKAELAGPFDSRDFCRAVLTLEFDNSPVTVSRCVPEGAIAAGRENGASAEDVLPHQRYLTTYQDGEPIWLVNGAAKPLPAKPSLPVFE